MTRLTHNRIFPLASFTDYYLVKEIRTNAAIPSHPIPPSLTIDIKAQCLNASATFPSSNVRLHPPSTHHLCLPSPFTQTTTTLPPSSIHIKIKFTTTQKHARKEHVHNLQRIHFIVIYLPIRLRFQAKLSKEPCRQGYLHTYKPSILPLFHFPLCIHAYHTEQSKANYHPSIQQAGREDAPFCQMKSWRQNFKASPHDADPVRQNHVFHTATR
ncbi:uncharacterized protein LY89DRAFT_453064 [Mollisia scopiformis]|uniref:Uncharacterized protein n=1 Tax=Mollisia scopiformis TaxID=149040 RepID=A0A194XKU8_MOLSC|nr:uncharacterized protein LY89DRAFT_453064 [Mollisia scopiformis]KUJ20719.1 hypothetical protein LY89DRAFT_453064 [Mollisia scopiformis]